MLRVEVVWQDQAGSSRVCSGHLEDLSDGGLSVRVQVEIGIGSKLTVRMPHEDCPGTVVQCHKEGWDSILGIKRDARQQVVGK